MRPMSDSLPMLLLRARETTMGFFRPILSEHGLSEQQWRVLRVLYENPEISAQTLAHYCYILSPSMTRILNRLEQERLIVRRRSENDMREQCIRLTQKGAMLFEDLSPSLEEEYNEIRDRVCPEKLDQLYGLLRELIEINGKEYHKRTGSAS